jgi:hypothetical protein
MQKPDEQIVRNDNIDNSRKIVNGVDISSVIGKNFFMYTHANNFDHIPSDSLGDKHEENDQSSS